MVSPLHIGPCVVGPDSPCFIIAEAGVNHNGDPALAYNLVDAAVTARADAIKFQTFTAEKLVVASAPKANYQSQLTDPNESQLAMIKRFELSQEVFRELHRYCNARGIVFLSTAFDEESADFLAGLGMSAFKIPSGELNNVSLLSHIARLGRPMLISTGMSTLAEVEVAVECVRANGCNELALLQCVSNYPADPKDVNLRAMSTMREIFRVPVGYSDHAEGTAVCLASVALGACVVEKHLTLDRSMPGPDHLASIEPQDFTALVRDVRAIEAALGSGCKQPAASEANTASVARRSVVAAVPIPAETILTNGSLVCRRPGTGLPPSMLDQLIGRRTRVAISAGTLLRLDMLE